MGHIEQYLGMEKALEVAVVSWNGRKLISDITKLHKIDIYSILLSFSSQEIFQSISHFHYIHTVTEQLNINFVNLDGAIFKGTNKIWHEILLKGVKVT